MLRFRPKGRDFSKGRRVVDRRDLLLDDLRGEALWQPDESDANLK